MFIITPRSGMQHTQGAHTHARSVRLLCCRRSRGCAASTRRQNKLGSTTTIAAPATSWLATKSESSGRRQAGSQAVHTIGTKAVLLVLPLRATKLRSTCMCRCAHLHPQNGKRRVAPPSPMQKHLSLLLFLASTQTHAKPCAVAVLARCIHSLFFFFLLSYIAYVIYSIPPIIQEYF